MSLTRYDWLVDGQPTQTRYTGMGDVTGSIEVGMEFETTGTTQELRTITVPFVGVTTDRTLLRGITGIYKNHLLSEVLRFIGKELLELVERPVIEFAVHLGSTPLLHTDFGQIFQCKDRIIRVYNLLRDTVINVSHKPSFSPGNFAEFPLGRTSAFGLQPLAKICAFGTSVLHQLGIKKGVVGADSDVYNTPVNTEYLLVFYKVRSLGFHLAVQVKCLVSLIKGHSGRFHLPTNVLPVIFGNCKCRFDTSFTGGKSSIPGVKTNSDHSLVVTHGRILFTERLCMALHRFQTLTRIIPCTLHKRGREIRNRLSDILVGGVVAVHLVCGTGVKSPFGTGVERHSVIPHGLQERLTPIRRNTKFQLNCPNHTHILTVLGNKVNGGEWCGAIHPTTKVVGFLAPIA